MSFGTVIVHPKKVLTGERELREEGAIDEIALGRLVHVF